MDRILLHNLQTLFPFCQLSANRLAKEKVVWLCFQIEDSGESHTGLFIVMSH